jgi:steroid delta-isomerase-like uncharacterized protein
LAAKTTAGRSALDVVSEYIAALSARDSETMDSLRSEGFVLDFVHGDAFENTPVSAQQAREFWPVWFAAFPELDWESTRTIAAEDVVVVQWVFTGTNTGPLDPPILQNSMKPTGRTIRLRGVSFFEIIESLIQGETMYIDLATLMVELGVEV